ncbi:MAG: hypothetical protein ACK5OC_08575 [Pirellula sp.]|jgi:hypothetical protein
MPSLQDSRFALRPNSKITLSPIVAELIRPRWWIAQHSIVAGKHLLMNIEELQVRGSAMVTSVEDCPEIGSEGKKKGQSHSITFTSNSVAIIAVKLGTTRLID